MGISRGVELMGLRLILAFQQGCDFLSFDVTLAFHTVLVASWFRVLVAFVPIALSYVSNTYYARTLPKRLSRVRHGTTEAGKR